MRNHHRYRARWAAVTTAILTPALILGATPAASASPTTDGPLAQGENWNVSTTPGGYLVTYNLDEPLPIVGDAPTLVIDGAPLGLATESADGMSLSITTTDPTVVSARDVEKGWASSEDEKAAENPAVEIVEETPNDELMRQLSEIAPFAADEDPADLGQHSVVEAEYDFGDRAVALAGIGDIRGEMTGKMYLTSAAGERPTVILLHGRHTSCSTGTSNPLRWPCGENQVNVRSYQGYEGTGRALASHGYNVLSIAANAVNSNDNQLALDYGAQARGQLILDTLDMLDAVNGGELVSFDDSSWPDAEGVVTTVTRTLDDALTYATTRSDAPASDVGMTAASLAGRFDLSTVGVMGHSRGGEGATSAVTLNQALEDPYGIVSVLPLAPVDFGRMTIPDIPMSVFLPYCDGDVSNQQGQHMVDDSRYAFDDNALRSAVWIMGTNHNFFNTVWTPGLYPYATGDDWSTRDTTSSCSTRDDSRLTPSEQYQVGVSYMTGFFRLTMGDEQQFQPLFDGSVAPSTPATTYADVRVIASQPASASTLVTDFAAGSSLIRTSGAASSHVCANAETATSIAPSVQYCTLRTVGTSRVPHWSPMRFGLDVEATPVTRLVWTGGQDPATPSTGELRVSVPEGQRDVTARSQLTVKMAPDRDVAMGTDATISVVDGAGQIFSKLVSEINPYAVNRMPGGTNTVLNKFVLQQVTIPLSEMSGINLADVREVRITAGVGADGTGAGGLYLSDLAFDTPTNSPAVIQTRTSVNIASTIVEEGSAPDTARVAAYLNRADSVPVTAWVSVVASGKVAATVQKVTFAAGETCVPVTIPTNGDTVASVSPVSAFTVSATNSANAVMGAQAFGRLSVREDDGVTGTTPETPAVGVQGDVCAELASSVTPGELAVSASEVAPGESVTLTATGFRAGEAVALSFGDLVLDPVIADAEGTAEVTIDTPIDAPLGTSTASALGLGSGRVLQAAVAVLAPTSVVASISEDSSLVEGTSLTMIATVVADGSGASSATARVALALDNDGDVVDGATVSFVDVANAETEVASAQVVDGIAAVTLTDGLAVGSYSIEARVARTETTSASSSAPLEFTILAATSDGEGTDSAGDTGADGNAGSDDSSVAGAAATSSAAGNPLAMTGGSGALGALLAAFTLLSAGFVTLAIRRRRKSVS